MSRPRPQRVTTSPDWYEKANISLGIRANGFVFVSGQAPVDEYGNTVGTGDFDAQARQAFLNVASVLKAAGGCLSDVVKVTIYVTDARYVTDMVELRREHFSRPYPADSFVEVSALARPEWMIEIDAIAVANG
ncbi:RidA family protein [Saccharomonospora saliphila]|uniref:RidA family protein n=1 Tax=Saccharomonospora saliphila TaxID=369829 RepID=UPI000361821F|nr:RidA family protein [Saccharomonospora saliphila]